MAGEERAVGGGKWRASGADEGGTGGKSRDQESLLFQAWVSVVDEYVCSLAWALVVRRCLCSHRACPRSCRDYTRARQEPL